MLEFAKKRREQYSKKWSRFDPKFTPLWVADMDFVICPHIRNAMQSVLQNETFGYTFIPSSATTAVAEWCEQHYHWSIDQDWIVWLPGIVPAFSLVKELFHRPDHKMLIQAPNYPPLLDSAKHLHKSFELIPALFCETQLRWHMNFAALEHQLKTSKISILSFANPANPLGYTFTKKELEQITTLCAKHDVLICSDEIHCDLSFDLEPHTPMGKISPKNSVTLMAASKTFNIAGLNTAFAIIPNEQLRTQFKQATEQRIGGPSILGATATAAAFKHSNPWRLEVLEYLQGNRDLIHAWGEQQKLEQHYLPEATHLYWLKLPYQHFIDNQIIPSRGKEFGDADFNRVNFACERSLLEEALDRLSST